MLKHPSCIQTGWVALTIMMTKKAPEDEISTHTVQDKVIVEEDSVELGSRLDKRQKHRHPTEDTSRALQLERGRPRRDMSIRGERPVDRMEDQFQNHQRDLIGHRLAS